MGVLTESWCFCAGGGKSEKMKAAIFTGKSPAMARINGGYTGFLIHRHLLLTTHANLPSPAAAEAAEICLPNGIHACLFPHRFFITSSVLDLTIVGLDVMERDSNQHLHYLKSCSKPNLDLGRAVYLLGYSDKQELGVGEGKVVVATDNLIKLSTEGVIWSPGSAGFDADGHLAFMVCDPMKLATSPNTKSCSASSPPPPPPPSWKRDLPMQFGIPLPIILDWLNQHWEGNLDELSNPKLPLKRLMNNDLSCGSFTMRSVFKPTEENEGTPIENVLFSNALEDDAVTGERRNDAHVSGIPTPEIYESPKLILTPKIAAAATQIQLLDNNFPPRMLPKPRDASTAEQSRKVPIPMPEEENWCENEPSVHVESSTGSVNGAQNDVQSDSDISAPRHDEYSSEGETTMYSAETAESRNFPSPSPGKLLLHNVGRSQSCVNYPRWGSVQRCSIAPGTMPEKRRSFPQSRRVHSQGTAAHDYFTPTVSSIMKKKNSLELQTRARRSAVHASPRWMF